MKIDLTSPIIDIEGNVIMNEKNEPMTLGDVFKTTLLTVIKGDEEDTADNKLWKWDTAQLCQRNLKGSVELKIEEVVKLKARVDKVFPSPVIYGNVCDFIDKATK